MKLPLKAASAWDALVVACRKNVNKIPVITYMVGSSVPPRGTGAYRDLELQQWMWDHRSSSTTGAVARPGASVHGEPPGCVDISNWESFGDIRKNAQGKPYSATLDRLAEKCGFRRTLWNEPWHYQYDGTTVAGNGTEPFEDKKEDMTTGNLYQYPSNGPRTTRTGSIPPGGTTHDFRPRQGDLFWEREPGAPLYLVPSADQYTRLVNAGLLPLTMDAAEIDGMCAAQGVTASPWLSVAPSIVNATIDLSPLVALINDLPTNGEMGQALTSTVALVNEHADTNKQEILNAIDDIPGGGTSGGNYSLSLNIDGVPGTATGTATPQ